jgi:hypothetical protein
MAESLYFGLYFRQDWNSAFLQTGWQSSPTTTELLWRRAYVIAKFLSSNGLIPLNSAVLSLLSPLRRRPSFSSEFTHNNFLNSPISPVSDGLCPSSSAHDDTVIYIDILPKVSFDKTRSGCSSSAWSDTGDLVRASDSPHLQSINPIIAFTSLSPIIAHSRFTVYSEDLILHAEMVPLVLLVDLNQAPGPSGFLYTTRLIPKYWDVISDSRGTDNRCWSWSMN